MTTRRNFLKATASVALIPLVNIDLHSAAAADKVPLDDPAAKNLKYVEDATTAERPDKMGVAGADQICDNCQFYAADADGDGWSGCALFQNRLVPAEGWCMAWVPKAG